MPGIWGTGGCLMMTSHVSGECLRAETFGYEKEEGLSVDLLSIVCETWFC